MSDWEAIRYIPGSFLICAGFSFGLMLMIGASWKFGIGLTLLLGTIVWMVVVADEHKKRLKATPVKERE